MTRILMVTKMPPHPPNMGGNQRASMIFRALSRHGKVDLLLAQDPSWLPPQHMDRLREEFSMVGCAAPTPRGACGGWRLIRPLQPRLVDAVAHHLGSRRVDFRRDPALAAEFERVDSRSPYDLVIGMELRVTFKAGFSRARPHIIDLIDLDTDYYRSRLAESGRGYVEKLLFRRHLRQLEEIVPALLAETKHVWVANPADLTQPGLAQAQVLPNIPYVGPGRERIEPLPPSGASTILFVGSFYHTPNVEGVERFLDRVWDGVVRDAPHAEFRIYGVGIGGKLQERFLRHRRVKILDPSGSLTDAYRQSAFTVAPIYSGAGTCFKVVESLAFGRTVVLTPYAGRGYDDAVRHTETAIVCGSDSEMARGCLELLGDADLRNRLAAAGAALVANHYSLKRFQSIVDATLQKVLG